MTKESMGELISVIIPIYNSTATLRRCLNSVITQTYSNLEIILINDGSTDDSLSICKEYEQLDNRIIVIDSINLGVSAARNLGLKKATGYYLGFVDSDDWIEPNHFFYLINGIKQNKDAILSIVGVVSKYWENYLETLCNGDEYCTLTQSQVIEQIIVRDGMGGYLWNKLFINKNLLLDENITVTEDTEFVVRYLTIYSNYEVVVKNNLTYHYNAPKVWGFPALRYSYERTITIFTSFDKVAEYISTILPNLEDTIRGYQCLQAVTLLMALDSDKLLPTDEKEKYYLIGEKYFRSYYSQCLHIASKKDKVKLYLFKIPPKIRVFLFKFTKIIKRS